MDLPYPPSINQYYAHSKRKGKRVLTKEAIAYKNLLAWQVKLAKFRNTIEMPVIAWIEFYPKDNHVRDIDNPQKALFDALQYAGVIKNDRLIREQHVKMCDKREDRDCFVHVMMIDGQYSEWK